MAIDFFWRLPTHGCHRSIRRSTNDRGDWSPLAPGNVAPGLNSHGEDDEAARSAPHDVGGGRLGLHARHVVA